MSGSSVRGAQVPVSLSPEDFPPQRLEVSGEAWIRPVIGPSTPSPMGAGIGTFEDASFAWNLEYDEVIYVVEGAVSVIHESGTTEAGEFQSALDTATVAKAPSASPPACP